MLDTVLSAIIEAAVDATAAEIGWIARLTDHDELEVVAAAGTDLALVGRRWPATAGTTALALGTGEPAVMARVVGDAGLDDNPLFGEGLLGELGRQVRAVVTIPCGGAQPLGVIELIDKAGSDTFDYVDLEIAAVLAPIAAAVLAASPPTVRLMPSLAARTDPRHG